MNAPLALPLSIRLAMARRHLEVCEEHHRESSARAQADVATARGSLAEEAEDAARVARAREAVAMLEDEELR